MYVAGTSTTPPVLPDTGAGDVFAIISGVTLAIVAAVALTTVVRLMAKKHYGVNA